VTQRLGEILIERGLIDERRLRAALSEAALWGRRLGEVLVARGDCDETAVLDALSGQLGVEGARLASLERVPATVLAHLGADDARRYHALPIGLDERTGELEVAMSDPADPTVRAAIEALTGRPLRARLALGAQIEAAIDRFYFDGTPPAPEPSFRRLATPAHGIARPARRSSVNRTPTPVRGLPATSTATPPRGIPIGPPPRPRQPAEEAARSGEWRGSERGSERNAELGTELGALHAEVEVLRRQLQRAYEALRETNIAQRVLLEHLQATGQLDLDTYQRAVKARIEHARRRR
jgi:HAMP domain-containing protein